MKLGRYIIGLLSGLTFGMLFAPKKGKELRKELSKKTSGSDPCSSCHEGAKVLGKAFKDAGEDAWVELKNLGEHEQVAALVELSQEKMKEFLNTAEERGYDVASFVQGKLESLAGLAKEKAEGAKMGAMNVHKKAIKRASATKKRVGKKVAATRRKVSKKAAKSTKRAAKAVTRIRRIKK